MLLLFLNLFTLGTVGNLKKIVTAPWVLVASLPSATATWAEMIREAASPITLDRLECNMNMCTTQKHTVCYHLCFVIMYSFFHTCQMKLQVGIV